ncbi:MAG: DUF3578 domain-containing protein [Bacteroidales bacterium]|nr:DUF3578 domain-containing protein [Bacteroidales bacterium]
MSYHSQLKLFLEQAETDKLKTKHFNSKYDGLEVKVSFGQGTRAKIPWISFLKAPNTTSNGIYPVYLYYRDFNILILAYGISETNIPEKRWKITNQKNISEYFVAKDLGKPHRYGSSFVYKVYNVDNMPSGEELDNDLNYILDVYKNQFKSEEIKPSILGRSGFKTEKNKYTKEIKFNLITLVKDIENSGLIYSKLLVTRFCASLLTKPFVILTGLSGSGKTKLAQAFVQWICHDEEQYRIIPVGADWTNREPLLGYPNALNPEEYVKPDSGVLDLIIRANGNQQLPYFLILDEMNLSHVERYFADFLSVMESKADIPLHAGDTIESDVPAKLEVPPNLFIIGTVNIDETTNMFSPKVLDRANTIEFRVTKKEMESFLQNIEEIDMDELTGKGAGMAASFLEMSQNSAFATEDVSDIRSALVEFFGELKKTGAEFGYRSATEILKLIHNLSLLDEELTTDQKIDIAIIQKLLPKLHGSRRKLCPVLETLGKFCVSNKDINIIKDIFEKIDYDFNNDNVLYPLSLEKIARMYRGAVDNGFASFAEA